MSKITNPNKISAEDHGQVFFHWQIPEYTKFIKGFFWYVFMGLCALGLLIYAFWTANFLFALIIGIIIFIVYLHDRHEPLMLDFKITEDGIQVGRDFYDYKKLKKFWIIYEPPEIKNLYFETYQILKRELSIPLDNINPVKVREVLLKYITEETEIDEESSIDRWSRLLKL